MPLKKKKGRGKKGKGAPCPAIDEPYSRCKEAAKPEGSLLWGGRSLKGGKGVGHVEALEAAGIAQGLAPATARALALATFSGAAELAASSSEPPSVLRERVTSKGGTTAAALAVMGEAGLPAIIDRAVAAAAARGAELGDILGQG